MMNGCTGSRQYPGSPDLPERFRQNASLNDWDHSAFYGADECGYTDYRALKELETSARATNPFLKEA